MRAKSASGSEYRAVNTLGSMEKGMPLGSKQESWNIPGPVNSKMHLDLAIVKGPTDVVIFFITSLFIMSLLHHVTKGKGRQNIYNIA